MTEIIIPEAKWRDEDSIIFGSLLLKIEWKGYIFTVVPQLLCGQRPAGDYQTYLAKISARKNAKAKAKRAAARAHKESIIYTRLSVSDSGALERAR